MNDVQTNQLGRAEKCATFLASHTTDLAGVPVITATLLPELQTRIQDTYDDDALATQDNTGNAAGKAEVRETLEESCYHVATGLVSYADDADDFVLQNMFDFTFSQVQGFRDARLQQYAMSVHSKAGETAIATALATNHNVSAADITELGTGIEDFDALIALPLTKKAESTAYGKLVDRDIKAVNETLDKIRRKMRTFRKTNRLLYDMWVAVDTIDDLGHGSAKGSVSGSVGIGETKLAAAIDPYDAAAAATLQNTGTTPLTFTVYLAGAAQGTGQAVAAGTSISTTLGALAADGDALYVTNGGSTAGSWSIVM